MAILIYPYSNPYRINSEPYWAMIKDSFHLCVSQTLVNGMCDQYADFYKGKLTTITRFMNRLFDNWGSDVTAIKQRVVIDNIIDYLDFSDSVNDVPARDIVESLKRNRKYVLESVRIMFELGMDPNNMVKSELTVEQKCVVAIYEELLKTNNKIFSLANAISEDNINSAIDKTIEEAMKANNKDVSSDEISKAINSVSKKTVVVHGIHQFSPLMLKTIELLSQYKNVVIIFNYQSDYKNVYQTWINVYEWFESKIQLPKQNFFDHNSDYKGLVLADSMAAMISGSTANVDYSQQIEVVEFDNQTEFAAYISQKFEDAEVKRKNDNYAHPTLFYMDEQFYAANSDVNDVLRVYFPEQFDEYDFLEYPIGHFFIAVTNIWDPETQSMYIKDINDIRECLSCGIISENKSGDVISIFDKCNLFLSNETTINGMIRRILKLKDRIEEIHSGTGAPDDLLRIDYYNVSENELNALLAALQELNQIVQQFFKDFNDQKNDFRSFYNKISDVLVAKVLEKEELDEEFRDIVKRVLDRLNEVKDVEANASFDCLKETMQLYLLQTSKEGNGANWIVRNFEQIDGDVLRRNAANNNKTYHFACLSDQDMSITRADMFPWPLDISFFEIAQAPVDWKYQVFVTSRMEYRNFRRYALVYGLAYSKCNVKLSYIKNKNDRQYDLYYMLKVLGAGVVPYLSAGANGYKENGDHIDFKTTSYSDFDRYDLIRFRLCPFRFLLESAIEGNTQYKDEFLLKTYMTVILEHRARKHFSGKPYIRNIVYSYLSSQMDDLSSDFPFINGLDISDSINTAIKYIEKQAVYKGKFSDLRPNEYDYMKKREEFLFVPSGRRSNEKVLDAFKDSTQDEVNSVLNPDNLSKSLYSREINSLCEKCSEKDICLELYKVKRG